MILFGPMRACSCPIFPSRARISNFYSHGLLVDDSMKFGWLQVSILNPALSRI
jgi:hypothetical protein